MRGIAFRWGPGWDAAAGRAAAAAALGPQVAQQGKEVLPLGAARQGVQRAVAPEITAFIAGTAAAAETGSGRATSVALFPPAATTTTTTTTTTAVCFPRNLL